MEKNNDWEFLTSETYLYSDEHYEDIKARTKIGSYVRTHFHGVGQVLDILENDPSESDSLQYIIREFGDISHPSEIVLVGETIWDVLRVGDFVNGHRIEKIERDVVNQKPKILTRTLGL